FVLQVPAEEDAREQVAAALIHAAYFHANPVERKDFLAARAITFFLHAIQHGEPDFRQFLGNLARGGSRKRALENRASELLQKLSDFHKICNSQAAPTTTLEMGAATPPPYPPCSTSTANAIRRAPSAGANPANHACGMP